MRVYKTEKAIEAFHYEDEASVSSAESNAWLTQMGITCGINNGKLALKSVGKTVVPCQTGNTGSWLVVEKDRWLVVENDHLRVLTPAEFAELYTVRRNSASDSSDASPLGEVDHTSRGFEIIRFKTVGGEKAELQQSSICTDLIHEEGSSALWLGLHSANPQVMARRAQALGVQTDQTTGWVPFPIPSDVLLSTRMHLDRDTVANLIIRLKAWLETGSFELQEPEEDPCEVRLEDTVVRCDHCGKEGQLMLGKSGGVCLVDVEGAKASEHLLAKIEDSG